MRAPSVARLGSGDLETPREAFDTRIYQLSGLLVLQMQLTL